MRTIRLVPVVMFACAALLALKTLGLLTAGGYTLGGSRSAQAEDAPPPDRPRSSAQDMLGYPDITGSIAPPAAPDANAPKADPAKAANAPAGPAASPVPNGIPVPPDGRPLSPSERAILERLQERRESLEARARELDIRENLIKAAEKRLEARVGELKDIEARINAAMNRKDEAEAARFKSLVSMYESMKAKDAAKIFDRLDMKILFEVASQINPRRMSDILALMAPEAAERLTVELANRVRGPDRTPNVADLPKIDGRPPAK